MTQRSKTQPLSCQGSTTILCRSMNCEPCKRLRKFKTRTEALAKKAELEHGLTATEEDYRAAPLPAQTRPATTANFLQQLPGGYCLAHGDYKDTIGCPKFPQCLQEPCLTCGEKLAIHSCKGPAKNSEPIEQAAPPRPRIDPMMASLLTQTSPSELLAEAKDIAEKLSMDEGNFMAAREAISQLVDAIVEVVHGCDPREEETQLRDWLTKRLTNLATGKTYAAPAAIEQARPQPCPQCENPKDRQLHNPECYAAAAEPTPERTPPQFQDALKALVQAARTLANRKHKGMRPIDEHWGDQLKLAIALSDFDRAVAVPEPAAQQESPREEIRASELAKDILQQSASLTVNGVTQWLLTYRENELKRPDRKWEHRMDCLKGVRRIVKRGKYDCTCGADTHNLAEASAQGTAKVEPEGK